MTTKFPLWKKKKVNIDWSLGRRYTGQHLWWNNEMRHNCRRYNPSFQKFESRNSRDCSIAGKLIQYSFLVKISEFSIKIFAGFQDINMKIWKLGIFEVCRSSNLLTFIPTVDTSLTWHVRFFGAGLMGLIFLIYNVFFIILKILIIF